MTSFLSGVWTEVALVWRYPRYGWVPWATYTGDPRRRPHSTGGIEDRGWG